MGTTKILIIDDEENIIKVMSRILETNGYAVAGALSHAEAQLLLEEHGPFDGAILDFSLEGSTCEETFRLLKVLSPGIKVIISSGFSKAEVERSFEQIDECDGFLKKPFGLQALVKAVNLICPPPPTPTPPRMSF